MPITEEKKKSRCERFYKKLELKKKMLELKKEKV